MLSKFISASKCALPRSFYLSSIILSVPRRHFSEYDPIEQSSEKTFSFLNIKRAQQKTSGNSNNPQSNSKTTFKKTPRVLFSKPLLSTSKLEDDYNEPELTKTTSTFEIGNAKVERERDDVHSRRLSEMTQITEHEESMINLRNELYKFVFDTSMRSIKVNLDDINIINIENEETFHKIPRLCHGLENLLKKPGIYPIDPVMHLQPDGGKFLKNIYQPEQIAFDRIPQYIPPSEDKVLLKFAKESKIKYVMSTSTISNVLSQIYYLFSGFKNPNFSNISESYANEPKKFMISQRKPTTNFLRKVDKENNIYALDNDGGLFKYNNSILMDLGKLVERSLTLTPEMFEEILLKSSKNSKNYRINDDHHRFMKLNNEICLRSQIDCMAENHITKQPFVFEIKTRSVCPIRYDIDNYMDYLDYKITSYRGLHSSFEREYYDLIRGSFLKYSFQLKIGRMDGAFISYHNTREIFGFEYVKTKEIERRIFGNEMYADLSFVSCSKLLIVLLDNLLKDLKDEKFEMIKIGFYSCSVYKKMIIFAELFDESFDWASQKLIDQTEDIKDEFDYFTKFTKFNERVYKFEFHVNVYINGILQKLPGYEISKGDQVEIKYRFERIGVASFQDYMNFLHEAYKMDSMNIDYTYVGAWLKNSM